MLVNTEQRAATKEPHNVAERAGIFIEHRIGAEQSLIPSSASVDISYRHSDMRYCGKLGHRYPPVD